MSVLDRMSGSLIRHFQAEIPVADASRLQSTWQMDWWKFESVWNIEVFRMNLIQIHQDVQKPPWVSHWSPPPTKKNNTDVSVTNSRLSLSLDGTTLCSVQKRPAGNVTSRQSAFSLVVGLMETWNAEKHWGRCLKDVDFLGEVAKDFLKWMNYHV